MSADICLILEGTYPYVRGGVSAWTHEMITRLDHLRFHIVTLLPRDEQPEQNYAFPPNVIGHTSIHLQRLPAGEFLSHDEVARLAQAIESPLLSISTGTAGLKDFGTLYHALARFRETLGGESLLNSIGMWELIERMYEKDFAETSMLDYFWSWRAVIAGLYSLMLPELPGAKVYHALSTGYAGVLLARAKLEKNRPCLLTEHGIYTNERRIEIALADWLTETASKTLTTDRTKMSLREFWLDTFANYSRICYEACDSILTLYGGNQITQADDGADQGKMRIIPNGVDLARFAALRPAPQKERPTVALIGRVVPIKDVKTFLRMVASLREMLPDIRALVLGPTDEDSDYVAECQSMVEYLALSSHVTFTGQVKIDDYLPEIDVCVISSISEAQPLVILEAGACGIPTVATDVGACREMIMGAPGENPRLGAGGAVVPLGSPRALAEEAFRLLTDRKAYEEAASAIKRRVTTYYDKKDQIAAYRELYKNMM